MLQLKNQVILEGIFNIKIMREACIICATAIYFSSSKLILKVVRDKVM